MNTTEVLPLIKHNIFNNLLITMQIKFDTDLDRIMVHLETSLIQILI
jgi:hypothetical protein